jgi:Ca2+/H+ antiporter, TMEM165/GDT1 family
MNLEKVVFGFFILLAATLNFGFVYGGIANPDHHNMWELFAAITVSLIAIVLKFGDRTHIGAVHLASNLVALMQLLAAALVWFFASQKGAPVAGATLASIVSLSAGALLANLVSVIIMIVDTTIQRR